MQVEKCLHNLLDSSIHQTRIKSLIPLVDAIVKTKVLQLTQLGRNLNTPGKERSAIRRVDRLLANPYFQNHSADIYAQIIKATIASNKRPWILVDWSKLPNSHSKIINGEHLVLRATLAAEGRGLTLYDEVHQKNRAGNPRVHQEFLEKLKSKLPEDCCPIIVVDAGFKIPFFRAVESLGWDYVGRMRGNTQYNAGQGYLPITELYKKASKTPKFGGTIRIGCKAEFRTHLYLYQHELKGRKKRTKSGWLDRTPDSTLFSRAYREPWILVSSFKNQYKMAERTVRIYKSRMTIEENFRDVKSEIFGFGMNENYTRIAARYIVWLMLSALASLIAWIVGFAAEQMELHRDFQANTYRHRRVLSFVYLGCQVIKKGIDIPIDFVTLQIKILGDQQL